MNYLLHPSSYSFREWQQSPPGDNRVAQRILDQRSIKAAKNLFNQCGLQALAGLPDAGDVQLYAHMGVQTLELFYVTPKQQRCQQVWLSKIRKQFCERELAWDSWLDDYGPMAVRIDDGHLCKPSAAACDACRKPLLDQM